MGWGGGRWLDDLGWQRELRRGGHGENRALPLFLSLDPDKEFSSINKHLSRPSEKAMTTHSSTLAWKTPWTEEPGGLQSMRSPGVGHD